MQTTSLPDIQSLPDTQRNARPTVRRAAELPERNAHLIALLDSFDDSDPEQQRQDFSTLQAGLDSARPGQRRLFGEGINPESSYPESASE